MTQATYARTQTYPLGDLTPYPGNAKRGDVDLILDSLRRNGQYRGLVVREVDAGTRIVLAGNHTLQALAAHGPGDCGQTVSTGKKTRPCGICGNDTVWVPAARCEIVTCDDDTARRVNLVDNKSADAGSYDDAALADLLSGLDGLEGTAWDDEELDELLKATGALGDASSEFLASFIEPDPQPTPTAPAPAGTPALNPFSEGAPPGGPPQTAAAGAPLVGDDQDAPGPAPFSPGVHTGPDAYSGPGARQHPGEPIALPEAPHMVPLQWIFTIDQRDTVRAAIKQAQAAHGLDTAAQGLTAVCAAYLNPTDSEGQ